MAGAGHGILERAVLGHQADRGLEIAVGDLAALERAPPELALGIGAAAEREHDRQRDLSLAKIVTHVLSELGRLAAVVERIVDQLERNAEVHPIRAARGLLGLRLRGQHRTDFRGRGKQLRRLGADHGQIFVLGGGGVLGGGELHHLALGNDGGGRRQDLQRPQRADLDHHLERLSEQKIADQHARLVAPHHARGELSPSHLAAVDHIVVEQRRGVHELHRRREFYVAVARVAVELRHGDGQHRTKPFSPGADQVVRDLRDHRHFRPGPRQDHRIDPLHVAGDQIDQRVDRGRGMAFERNDDGQSTLRAGFLAKNFGRTA